MEIKQKKLPKSQIELEFELTAEEFQHHFEHALSHMKSHVKVDGFRPGQAPNKLVEEKIKPESLLMEAGEHAVRHVYSDYVKENNLEPIGNPEVKILKIAKGSPFVFTATFTVLPDVELPDYKKIAKTVKGKDAIVSEQEVQDSLNYLQKTRAKFSQVARPAEKGDFVEITYQNKDIENNKEMSDRFILGEAKMMKGFEDNVVGMRAGEEREFKAKFPENNVRNDLAGKEGEFKVKVKSVQKMELPEINDEFAKQLGVFSAQGGPASGWDTLDALKDSIKKGLTDEKTEAEKQRKRGEILEKIAEKMKFSAQGGPASGGELPQILIDQEKQRLMEDLKQRVTKNMKGFSAQGGPASGWEQYLTAVNQTEEQLKETFQKEAEKRLKGFLVLREIGKKEKIEVSDKELEEETQKALENYRRQHAGHDHDEIDINQLKEYTKGVLFNEKVFKLLEQ